jgi:hypothetical protein
VELTPQLAVGTVARKVLLEALEVQAAVVVQT